MEQRSSQHSIKKLTNRSLPTEKKIKDTLPQPRLGPTRAVIGNFQPPEQLKGNCPDVVLIAEARHLLNYKTNYTLLEWWESFPVNKWWRYAIMATKGLARGANYKYFLKCLLTAAQGGKRFEAYYQYLARFFKALMASAKGEAAPPPVCSCGSICEKCQEAKYKYYSQHLPEKFASRGTIGDSPGEACSPNSA